MFDRRLTWSKHIDYIFVKCYKTLNLMRCVCLQHHSMVCRCSLTNDLYASPGNCILKNIDLDLCLILVNRLTLSLNRVLMIFLYRSWDTYMSPFNCRAKKLPGSFSCNNLFTLPTAVPEFPP